MPAAIEQATRVLKDNHFKITKQRTAMIEFLVGTATNRFVDVTSIDEFMRKTFPKMSHNTIYRNISEFADLGIVERQVQGDPELYTASRTHRTRELLRRIQLILDHHQFRHTRQSADWVWQNGPFPPPSSSTHRRRQRPLSGMGRRVKSPF